MNAAALIQVETSARIMAVAAASAVRCGPDVRGEVARDVMVRNPPRVACEDSLMELASVMRSLLVAFLPVCDQSGDLHGIVALRDVQRAVRGAHSAMATAASLAREPAVTIGVDDPVDGVWDLMAERRMWLLPVMDGRQLAGVIRYAAHPAVEMRGKAERLGARRVPSVS